MQYVPLVPREGPMAGRIEVIFWLDAYQPEHRIERLVPDGSMNLVIELDGRERRIYDKESREPIQRCRGAWLSGVHTSYLLIGDTQPESRLAAVRFAPGQSVPFVHRPASDYVDRVVDADEVLGEEIVELRSRLLERTDGVEATHAIAHWLEARYQPSRVAPRIVSRTLERLSEAPSEVRLTALVEEDGTVSYRHFVELFRRHVGPTPKVFQRILRFARVFERLQAEPPSWAALSAELGYADQAHFIRDFRAFSGYRPSEFAQGEHDRVNFFPDDPGA